MVTYDGVTISKMLWLLESPLEIILFCGEVIPKVMIVESSLVIEMAEFANRPLEVLGFITTCGGLIGYWWYSDAVSPVGVVFVAYC